MDPRAAQARQMVDEAFRRALRGSRIGMLIGGGVFLAIAAAALVLAAAPAVRATVFGPAMPSGLFPALFGAVFGLGGLLFLRGAAAMRPPDPRLLAEGRPGRATLREVKSGGMSIGKERFGTGFSRMKLLLDVQVDGGTPYPVTHTAFVPPGGYRYLKPGTELAVRVDPTRPTRLAVEWP